MEDKRSPSVFGPSGYITPTSPADPPKPDTATADYAAYCEGFAMQLAGNVTVPRATEGYTARQIAAHAMGRVDAKDADPSVCVKAKITGLLDLMFA